MSSKGLLGALTGPPGPHPSHLNPCNTPLPSEFPQEYFFVYTISLLKNLESFPITGNRVSQPVFYATLIPSDTLQKL